MRHGMFRIRCEEESERTIKKGRCHCNRVRRSLGEAARRRLSAEDTCVVLKSRLLRSKEGWGWLIALVRPRREGFARRLLKEGREKKMRKRKNDQLRGEGVEKNFLRSRIPSTISSHGPI